MIILGCYFFIIEMAASIVEPIAMPLSVRITIAPPRGMASAMTSGLLAYSHKACAKCLSASFLSLNMAHLSCILYIIWYNSTNFAPVAQLDRATDCGSVGQRFESSRARHEFMGLPNLLEPYYHFFKVFVKLFCCNVYN